MSPIKQGPTWSIGSTVSSKPNNSKPKSEVSESELFPAKTVNNQPNGNKPTVQLRPTRQSLGNIAPRLGQNSSAVGNRNIKIPYSALTKPLVQKNESNALKETKSSSNDSSKPINDIDTLLKNIVGSDIRTSVPSRQINSIKQIAISGDKEKINKLIDTLKDKQTANENKFLPTILGKCYVKESDNNKAYNNKTYKQIATDAINSFKDGYLKVIASRSDRDAIKNYVNLGRLINHLENIEDYNDTVGFLNDALKNNTSKHNLLEDFDDDL